MEWNIGCSGFHYKEWKGIFYPEKLAQRKWFGYYSAHFNTLELNVTIYRFPRVGFLRNWYELSPAGFSFSVKAPRLITHYKQFLNAGQQLTDFYSTIREGLDDKLACVLFQLPSRVKYSREMLQRITDGLDPAFLNVIEFRHESWWTQEVYDVLAKHHICFCGISHPDLPDDPIINTDFMYYRYHGVPKLYWSEYADADIGTFAEVAADAKLRAAYVYFNNTASMAAIHNAMQLQQYAGWPVEDDG
jgi:uncharacterized protein YecE (DUF72 family)